MVCIIINSEKDIENSISILNDKGIIFLHDCLPNSVKPSGPRTEVHWNGDVWKAFVEVRCKPFRLLYMLRGLWDRSYIKKKE